MLTGKLLNLGTIVLLFVWNNVLSSAELVDQTPMTESECKEAGFNSATLKCSACQLLPQFNLEEIMTDCLGCCTKESTSEDEHERYPLAEFEICECNLHRFPQITAFVRGTMKDQWGSKLKIRHVRGTLPTIALKDEDGQTQKSLNVEKWDTDTITEFLNDWLVLE